MTEDNTTTSVVPAQKMAALYTALAKAQAEFLPIEKNREGQDGNRRFPYADLEEIIKKTRPALTKNGLAVIQLPQLVEKGHILITILAHQDGGTIQSEMRIPELGELKKFGGGITYLRRYAYQAVVGVTADDDLDNDGQEAGAFTGTQAAPTGKAAVQMPQRRTANQEQPRADKTRTAQPVDISALATAGEFAYLENKITAAGIDWARAHELAGIEFVPDTQLTKAAFAAIKAVL